MSAQPPPHPRTEDGPEPSTGAVHPGDASAPAWPPLPTGWWRGTQPQATFPVPFSVGDGFGLFAWSIVGQFVLGFPIGLLFGLTLAPAIGAGEDNILILSLVVATFTGIFASTLLYLRLRGRLSWHLLGPVRPSWSHVGWGVVAGIGGFLGVQLTIGLVLTLLGEEDVPQQEILQTVDGTTSIVLLVLGAVVLAPLVEEVIFRGVLFQALRRRLGLWPAVVISSLGFGFIHIEVIGPDALVPALTAAVLLCIAVVPAVPLPLRMVLAAAGLGAAVYAVALGGFSAMLLPLGLSTLGAIFALGFHRTGGLLLPIVGHAVFNAIAVGLTVLMQGMDVPGV